MSGAASPATVRLERVSKSFGDVVALSDLTCRVGPGMTALLGPNGAGKSTALRLICGLTCADDGRVEVFGTTVREDPGLARRIGLVPQQESLFAPLTAHDFVATAAALQGVERAGRRATGALEQVALDPDDPRPLRHYSKGMRQRVKLAQALVHDPDLLVLDEPLDGLDPTERARMITLFQELAGDGRTVLVSSHVLEEVQQLGARILLLARGRLVAEGDVTAIREAMDDRPRRLRIRTTAARPLAAGLLAAGVADGVSISEGGTITLETNDVRRLRRSLAVVARERGARLLEVVPLDESLESVFRDLVGPGS